MNYIKGQHVVICSKKSHGIEGVILQLYPFVAVIFVLGINKITAVHLESLIDYDLFNNPLYIALE